MASGPLSRGDPWSFCNWRPGPGAAGEHKEAGDCGCGGECVGGANFGEMLKVTKQMLSQGDGWKNPFGDGKASNLILDLLRILSGE